MNKLGPIHVGGSNPTRIMGILNTSPESFYKKSIKTTKQKIIHTITEMENNGVDVVDVGGMSTAPYLSTMVSEKIESERILNAIKVIQQISNIPISIDTCRANVAQIALENGVEIINDISGLQYDPHMIQVIEKFQPFTILCAYSKDLILGDQVLKTKQLLQKSIQLAKSVNINTKKIIVDPAIGFFRKLGNGPFFTKINSDWVQRDLDILTNLFSIKQEFPILVSISNKSFIGKLQNKKDPMDRLYGTLSLEAISVINGADIIRTHNVLETKNIIKIAEKFRHTNKGL